jgi:hypothetical protein
MKLPKASLQTIAAQHEAAHAVMRKLCLMKATWLSVDGRGGGYCAGSGERIHADDNLLVTLAGMAWETGCRFTLIKWETARFTFVDAGEAWRLVNDVPCLCQSINPAQEPILQEPAAALNRWFAKAGDMLKPHRQLIRQMGNILQADGFLTARQVAALLRKINNTSR